MDIWNASLFLKKWLNYYLFSNFKRVIAQYPVDLLYVIKPEPIVWPGGSRQAYKCRLAFYMPPV